MARQDVVEPFFANHVDGRAQAADQLRCRCVGEIAEVVGLDHVFEREEAAVHAAIQRFIGIERLLADGQDAETRRQHEALLRARDAAIDAPFAHAHVERANRRHAIDHQECGMLGCVERLAHAGDIAGNAGCGFVVGGKHRLDFVRGVLGENVGILLEWYARAPFFIAQHDFQSEPLGHIDPEQRELTEARHQNFVANGERVGDGRFPRARTRRGENENAAVLHFENLLEVFKQRQGELRKLGRAHVLHGEVHGHSNLVWNCRRARDEQMGRDRHGRFSEARVCGKPLPALALQSKRPIPVCFLGPCAWQTPGRKSFITRPN